MSGQQTSLTVSGNATIQSGGGIIADGGGYANLSRSISNQNYLAVSTFAPALRTQVRTNGIILSWYGILGGTYQTFYSTNLVDWWWYGASIAGTNGPLQLLVPTGTEPSVFFRMGLFY
jgi:hypothetical protein